MCKFRLPTKEEFEKLAELKHEFKNSAMHFYEEDRELVLPAEGYRSDTIICKLGTDCYYWSSTYLDSYYAYYFYFNSNNVNTSNYGNRYYGRSVRLVSEDPFDGSIKMAGLYWKPTNEPGLYTWEEAMELEKTSIEQLIKDCIYWEASEEPEMLARTVKELLSYPIGEETIAYFKRLIVCSRKYLDDSTNINPKI